MVDGTELIMVQQQTPPTMVLGSWGGGVKVFSTAHGNSLPSFFPVCIPLISLSYFFLIKTLSTIWNKVRESGYLCSIPNFRRNTEFFHLSITSALGGIILSYNTRPPISAFILLKIIPSMPSFFRKFITKIN